MEYILLFSFSLIIVGILWSLSGSNIDDAQWELQMAYAKNSLNTITQTADSVYIQGSPAQMFINTDLPDNVNAVYIQNNTVIMELRWKEYLRNISSYSIANLTGSINQAAGRHRLLITAGQIVNISES